MGCIIHMNSETFINDLLKEYDHRTFQYVLISQDITTEKRYNNAISLTGLLPSPDVITEYINEGFTEGYKKECLNFYKKPEKNSLIAILVNMALKGFNIVLLCSAKEEEFKYLKLLCDFIEEQYKLLTYTYKKYNKNPEKAMKIENVEEVGRILTKKMESFQSQGINIQENIDPEKYLKKLKKLSSEELRAYAGRLGVKVNSEISDKKILKKLKKLLRIE